MEKISEIEIMAAEISNAYKVGFCIVMVDFCVIKLSSSASEVLCSVQGRNGRQRC